MSVDLAGVRWLRIVGTAVAAFAASMGIVFLVIGGYAFTLGVQARGAPDQAKISAFADLVAPIAGPTLLMLFTLVGASRTARRATDPVLHGVLVGTLAAILGLLPDWPPNLRGAAIFLVVVVAGCLGGVIGGRVGRLPRAA